MPEITPQRQAVGCFSLISILGGFGAGVTLGFRDSHGVDMTPAFEHALKYGPSAISAALGYISAKDILGDSKALNEMTQNVPACVPIEKREEVREFARGCAGCSPITTPIISAGFTALVTYGGYCLGRSL